jgi:sugar phosphate isomerase/epimerase
MSAIKGPGIFLAQFLRDEEPYNNLTNICKWVSKLGYKGVQIPTWDKRVIDLDKAAQSKAYCDDLQASLKTMDLDISELAAHLQSQVLAIHPAYETAFAPFYPSGLNDVARVEWATSELIKSVKASANLGLKTVPVLSGALAWHMMYPWPQRPAGLIDMAFKELYRRWKPVLDAARDEDITITYELHPGSDIYDGATFEMFLDISNNHPAACLCYDPSHFVLQQLDATG